MKSSFNQTDQLGTKGLKYKLNGQGWARTTIRNNSTINPQVQKGTQERQSMYAVNFMNSALSTNNKYCLVQNFNPMESNTSLMCIYLNILLMSDKYNPLWQ